MSETEQPGADAWFDLELDRTERVQVGSRRRVVVGIVVVLALAAAGFLVVSRGGSSDAQARISSFHAAMVDRPSFTYELDLIAENVTSAAMEDIVPGGPVEVLQIDGTVAAEDRFALQATHSLGVDEIVRVESELFQRATSAGDDGEWWREDYEAPEPPTVSEVRASLEPEGDMDAAEMRLRAISGIYLNRMVLDPAHLPAELANLQPEVLADAGPGTSAADAFDDQVPVAGSVPFPLGYQAALPDVAPMAVTVELGPDGHPTSAQLEIRDAGMAILAELRFADWGADLEVVAPEGAKEAKQVFEEVGTAIEDDSENDAPIDDRPTDGPGSLDEPRELDRVTTVWMPTNVPDDFQLVDLEAADLSGDDSCSGIFAIWIASDRPAAEWVSQETPDEDNSQLLTVRSVPADCSFVERTPLFEPGPFGDRPARRIGDQWEVLLDDSWVVRFDSVVVTWDELVAMVSSLDTVSVESLEAQLG